MRPWACPWRCSPSCSRSGARADGSRSGLRWSTTPSRRSPARARSTRATATATTSRSTSAADPGRRVAYVASATQRRSLRVGHTASVTPRRPTLPRLPYDGRETQTLQGERRPVAAQPGTILAPGRPAAREQRPETRRVVEDLQVADLVPDDVFEHLLGRKQQAPVEAHASLGRARGPARALPADLKVAVGPAGQNGGPVQTRPDLGARGAPVEALQRWARVPVGYQQLIAAAVDARAP